MSRTKSPLFQRWFRRQSEKSDDQVGIQFATDRTAFVDVGGDFANRQTSSSNLGSEFSSADLPPSLPVLSHEALAGVEVDNSTVNYGDDQKKIGIVYDIHGVGSTRWLSLEHSIAAKGLLHLNAAIISIAVTTEPYVEGLAMLRIILNNENNDCCTQKFRFNGKMDRHLFVFDIDLKYLENINDYTEAKVIFLFPIAPIRIEIKSIDTFPFGVSHAQLAQ